MKTFLLDIFTVTLIIINNYIFTYLIFLKQLMSKNIKLSQNESAIDVGMDVTSYRIKPNRLL